MYNNNPPSDKFQTLIVTNKVTAVTEWLIIMYKFTIQSDKIHLGLYHMYEHTIICFYNIQDAM